jgi:hypothetical protein
MDPMQAANLAPQYDELGAAAVRVPHPPAAPRSVTLPISLLSLALVVVGAGAPLLIHFGGTVYPIAWAAAVLAVPALMLLLVGGWRRRAVGGTRLLLGLSIDQWSCFAVFIFFLGFYGITRGGPTPFYEPSAQAEAFVHGHSWVTVPDYMEQVRYHDHRFLVHPPLAGIVMMPIVAVMGGVDGADRYQPSVCAVMGAIEVALAWRLLLVLGMSTSAALWLTAFFGIGTTLWYEATLGSSWDFVLVVSVLPTLLALNEVFGKARPWVVGVLAALAALGRNDLVMAWPIYGLLLLLRGRGWRELFRMGPGFAMAGVVYGIFNYSRYGTFFDQSLRLWYLYDGAGIKSHPGIPGPFSIHFLPANLYTLLFLGWGLGDTFPWIHPQGAGQALLLTSPAFILALRPSLKRAEVVLMWLAALLTMSASLVVYASGFVQFGVRYYVQVFPFLLVLLAWGVGQGKRLDQLTKILILASILVVSYGIWHIRTIGFG